MREPAIPAFDRLFEHQAWVRALAERLSRDDASADDLVQETWIEALRARIVPGSPRPWLGGIVRNLARRSRRASTARERRERVAARGERLPSADALLAQAELQRRVLGAVATLGEAHRVVVLLRYVEGLSGEEIAERLGVPGSTVRNRLARALEQLRARVDGEYGDRAAWATLLVPMAGDATTRALVVGGGVMKLQIALAAVAVAVATALWWPREVDRPQPAPELAAGHVPGRAAVNAALPAAVDAEPADSLAARAPAGKRVERPLVFGRVLGPDAADLENATVRFLGADGLERSSSVGPTSAYSVFGSTPGPAEIRVDLRGWVPLVDALVVPDDQERVEHDLVLQRALVLPVRFTDLAGEALDLPAELPDLLAAVATRDQPAELHGISGRRPGPYGAGIWRPRERFDRDSRIPAGFQGVIEIREPAPVWVSAVLRECVLESRVVRGSESELVFALDAERVRATLGSIALRLVDGTTGEPLAGTTVRLAYRDSSSTGGTTDEEGRLLLESVVPGPRGIDVDGALANVRRHVVVLPGERVDLGTIEVFPKAVVRGRVVDAEGRGASAQLTVVPVRLLALEGAQAFDTRRRELSAADGTFELQGVEAGRLRIVARSDDGAPAAVEVDAASGQVEGLELRLRRGTPVELRCPAVESGSVEFVIVDASGGPLAMSSAYPGRPARLRLAPGDHALLVLRGGRVVRDEILTVGSDLLVREIGAP